MNRQSESSSMLRRSVATCGLAGLVWSLAGCCATGEMPGPSPVGQPVTVRGQDESDGLLSAVNPARLLDAAKRGVGLGPDQDVAKQAFADAEKIFVEATALQGTQRTKRFLEAAELYEKAANRWPDSACRKMHC